MKAERRAHYMLRRTLPIWNPGETIEEAVDYCREYGVGEVIWKIDAEDFSRGHPAHAWIGDHLPWLEKGRDMLGEYGIWGIGLAPVATTCSSGDHALKNSPGPAPTESRLPPRRTVPIVGFQR